MSSSKKPLPVPAPEGKWDLIIRPHAGWFDLHLGDLWRYRDLALLLVWRDFVSQYKQTILGPLWFVIQPLLTTIMFTIVFGNMAGLSTDGLPKVLFYMSGQVVWGYFSGSLMATSTTFVSNAHIFGKVYFPRLVVPVSIVISELFQFGLRLLFLLAFWAWFALRGADIRMTGDVALLPVAVLIMATLALGMGVVFSSLTTKYRDLRFLLTFGVQLLMFATPAIYPLSALTGRYRLLMLLNPITPIMELFRSALLGTGTWTAPQLLYSAACAVVALALGAVLFTRVEQNFMDTV
jgi:lipopolysaccharide transport system permease protein